MLRAAPHSVGTAIAPHPAQGRGMLSVAGRPRSQEEECSQEEQEALYRRHAEIPGLSRLPVGRSPSLKPSGCVHHCLASCRFVHWLTGRGRKVSCAARILSSSSVPLVLYSLQRREWYPSGAAITLRPVEKRGVGSRKVAIPARAATALRHLAILAVAWEEPVEAGLMPLGTAVRAIDQVVSQPAGLQGLMFDALDMHGVIVIMVAMGPHV